MKIRIPKKLKDFTLLQMRDTLAILVDQDLTKEAHDIETVLELVSIFSGVDSEVLMDADITDIRKAYWLGVKSFSSYERKLPPDEVVIKGKTYSRVKFEDGKTKGGWFVDCKTMNAEFQQSPHLLAAINYVEKGKKYSEKDREGFITNPTRERAELFKTEFQPDIFLNMHVFFLSLSESWNNAFLTLQTSEVLKRIKEATRTTTKK